MKNSKIICIKTMEVNKKYKLTDETKVYNGKTLYRIEALKDFAYVQKGSKGGFVESEQNLSQEDYCWIYHDAMVYGNAIVSGYAEVANNAIVCGCSKIGNNALVCEYAFVNDSHIVDDAVVCGHSKLDNGVTVGGSSNISGNVEITNNIVVENRTHLRGY